jgi:hypothetical protein
MMLRGRLLPATLLLLLVKATLIGAVFAGCVVVGSWALWCCVGAPVVFSLWRWDT